MDTALLLQRQMELHGTLRHPPRTALQLKEIHTTMRQLLDFIKNIEEMAEGLHCSPETVFQSLMHIGAGNVTSLDNQRRDGAVPMHQAKVLARAKAIELEPLLRKKISPGTLDILVALCKKTRTVLRIKVEDGNDLGITRKALVQALEYLDYIESISGELADHMFALYMVEDEASLLTLLGKNVTTSPCSATETETAVGSLPPLPTNEKLGTEVLHLAQLCECTTALAGDRLVSLQTINFWLRTLTTEMFHHHIRQMVSHLVEPLSICAAEKRSAICRHACSIMITIAERTSSFLFQEKSFQLALPKWCTVLVRGVYVTVSTISQATDAALRALIIGSKGDATLLKRVVDSLESCTHPELRRKCLGYLTLGVAASQGDLRVGSLRIAEIAQKYTGVGNAVCRRMARVLCITLQHFGLGSARLWDSKIENLMKQEAITLQASLMNVKDLENALFSPTPEKQVEINCNATPAPRSALTKCTSSSFVAEPSEDYKMSSSNGIYNTFTTLGGLDTPQRSLQASHTPNVKLDLNSSEGLSVGISQNRSLGEHEADYKKSKDLPTVKLSTSLRRRIQENSLNSVLHK